MKFIGLLSALLVVGSLGCSPSSEPASQHLKVTATTSMVADLAKSVGGDRVVVQGLMGPGVDPHLYKATASDVTKLQQADVIFYSGLMLEGKMQELFDKLKNPEKSFRGDGCHSTREAAQAGAVRGPLRSARLV